MSVTICPFYSEYLAIPNAMVSKTVMNSNNVSKINGKKLNIIIFMVLLLGCYFYLGVLQLRVLFTALLYT